MHTRGYGKFRFAAVSVLVVLALTGFSTGSHHGIGKSSGKHRSGSSDSDSSGGGGGCSSSSQDHDGSSSGGSSATTGQDAVVDLLTCATESDPYATLRLTNPNSTGDHFTVTVRFYDAGSRELEERTAEAYVAGDDTTTVQVALSGASVAAKVDHCEPDPYAPVAD
ncbi:hypothetical protein U5640_25775 [Streptomyces sp. SS7]|uniref:hypothetical protein n=1 Tax=Streptomyces sp. SS7 TaxID=3108485 RepID=UPI0030EBA8FD